MIRDSFWTDSYIEKLSPDEKLIFLYLLTNPLCNIAGVYEVGNKRIGFDTGYDIQVVDNILLRFETDGKIIRFKNWIIIKNFIKNQSVNPKVKAGIERILSDLPAAVKNHFFGDIEINSNPRSTVGFSEAIKRDKKCVLCNSVKDLEVDHIKPLFLGGDNVLENLQVLCRICHQKKTSADFIAYGESGGIGYRTLLNSTLPNLIDSEADASADKNMPFNKYADDHEEGVVDLDGDGSLIEIKKTPTKKYPHASAIQKIFLEVLGRNPSNWRINKTQLQACENLYTERTPEKVRSALEFFKEHKHEEYCPQITSPYDLDSKWTKLGEYKLKL